MTADHNADLVRFSARVRCLSTVRMARSRRISSEPPGMAHDRTCDTSQRQPTCPRRSRTGVPQPVHVYSTVQQQQGEV